jgi:murein L,D-transpeptidase YafK
MRLLLIPLILIMQNSPSFKEKQLSHSRVKTAYDDKEQVVKGFFTKRNIEYNGFKLFIRAFKKEERLEVWVQPRNSESYTLLQTYAFCSSSGTLGPKRKEGDYQIPEGVYHINHFNPQSNFHLSLGVSYPNESDKVFSDKKQPGGAIYIHGNCVTIGCIPITDDKIKELYVLAVEARNFGQKNIPIHIFPSKLDDEGLILLKKEFGDQHVNFWQNLKPIYEDFENSKKLRKVTVNDVGRYVVVN